MVLTPKQKEACEKYHEALFNAVSKEERYLLESFDGKPKESFKETFKAGVIFAQTPEMLILNPLVKELIIMNLASCICDDKFFNCSHCRALKPFEDALKEENHDT